MKIDIRRIELDDLSSEFYSHCEDMEFVPQFYKINCIRVNQMVNCMEMTQIERLSLKYLIINDLIPKMWIRFGILWGIAIIDIFFAIDIVQDGFAHFVWEPLLLLLFVLVVGNNLNRTLYRELYFILFNHRYKNYDFRFLNKRKVSQNIRVISIWNKNYIYLLFLPKKLAVIDSCKDLFPRLSSIKSHSITHDMAIMLFSKPRGFLEKMKKKNKE